LIRAFYRTDLVSITDSKLFWNVSENLIGIKISHDVVNPKTKEVICHAGKKISHSIYNLITKGAHHARRDFGERSGGVLYGRGCCQPRDGRSFA
jgi:hypothetical protein